MSKNDNLEAMRHSAAHLLAAAVYELWPDTKFAIGPFIEDGFYYDFEFRKSISENDLPKIENKMEELKRKDLPLERYYLTFKEALAKSKGQPYKKELIKPLKGKKISFYRLGDFEDLCSGPHVKSASQIGAFKLLSIAGAYWRGDEKNKMLTRIYGTAFPTKKELDRYLSGLKEAEKRNHRKIGRELELFAGFSEVGQGLPVWLPKGYAIRRVLEDYMLNAERKHGYQHLLSPIIARDELFKTSGHLGFFDESMYPPLEVDDEKYYLKPMNCPFAMMVYKMRPRSYRDLPLKLGELGTVYRHEQSGELHGMQRVRGFTQNDAHIFCTKAQLKPMIEEAIDIMLQFYKDLGFSQYKFVLALSEKNSKKYIGSREGWKHAEGVLRDVLKDRDVEFREEVGEATFYGPKIDVQAVNVFGKEDTISTIQVDFNQPERFKLEYVTANGSKEQPFVVHRALVGSFERFFAFLIEYYGGAFPVWLAPVQAVVLPVSEKQDEYAKKIYARLQGETLRTQVNLRSETLQAKIRDATLQKVPYMLIVGKREEKSGEVALRLRDGTDRGSMKLDAFIKLAKSAVDKKSTSLA